jgi:hypothetical protein
MFKRCIWCGGDKALTKEGKSYFCNLCTFVHTVNAAKTVAKLSDEKWAIYSAERQTKRLLAT